MPQKVEVVRVISAPRRKVWDAYTDHASWGEWAGVGKARLDREGTPSRNGVGCVRVLGAGPVAAHEEVLKFDPPHLMTYRVVKGGLPMRNHLGEVRFEDVRGKTRVVWRCEFDSKIPGLGPLLRLIVKGVFRRALEGLERKRFGENAS